MLECLQFIFSSFWVWLGTVVLLGLIAECISGLVSIKIVKIFRDKK